MLKIASIHYVIASFVVSTKFVGKCLASSDGVMTYTSISTTSTISRILV